MKKEIQDKRVLYALEVMRVHMNKKVAWSDVSSDAGELMVGSELSSDRQSDRLLKVLGDGESKFWIVTEQVCRSEWRGISFNVSWSWGRCRIEIDLEVPMPMLL